MIGNREREEEKEGEIEGRRERRMERWREGRELIESEEINVGLN